MRLVKVVNLKGGEILAQDIVSDSGQILIQMGTILKMEYIDILIQLNIRTIHIQINKNDKVPIFPLLPIKERNYYYSMIKEIIENHIYNNNQSLWKANELGIDIVNRIMKRKDESILIEERNDSIYEHISNVTFLSVHIANLLNLGYEKMVDIAHGCILHDLGLRYVTIPYINKEIDEFTANELYEYKKHTIYGYTAVTEINWLSNVSKNIILSHHETIDGMGYPLKQKIKRVEVNIVQVCDCFEGYLTGIGCKKLNKEDALQSIVKEKNTKYDKKTVELLKKIVV